MKRFRTARCCSVPAVSVVMVKLLLIAGGCLLSGGGVCAEESRPNFIIINIDDLGYADIGPFGARNKTPELDRMAREGRKLTSHYAAPVCSPSRAALMTGCYPKRAMPIPHVLFPVAAVGLHPEEQTIAEVLKTRDYATACIGKWHLGDQADFLPTRQGFDSFFGLPYSNDMGPATDGTRSNLGRNLPEPIVGLPQFQQDETGIRGGGQPPLALLENEKVLARVQVEEQFQLTRQYTERAVQFIQENREQPFFLYLPHSAIHFPFYPREEFQESSTKGVVEAWVEEVDWSVGEILKTLREQNLSEKTLVIFTSDNGGVPRHGSGNEPLRGAKGQVYEGGIRVCTIAWWPGKIPAGTETTSITSMMDFLPTLARLAEAKLPEDRRIDGVDLWPTLTGTESGTPPRDHFFYFQGLDLKGVRQGDWKLLLPTTNGQRQVPLQLYNLQDDLSEKFNVAQQHPEIVQKLQALIETMREDLGLEGIGPGCRPLGRVQNPLPLIDHDGYVRPDALGTTKHFPRRK